MGIEKHLVMVAADEDRMRPRREPAKQLQNTPDIRAFVDVVTEEISWSSSVSGKAASNVSKAAR